MKKLLCILLTLACLLSFAACGNSSTASSSSDVGTVVPASDTDVEETAAPEETEEPETTDAENTSDADTASDTESDLAYVQDKGTLIVGITEFEPMDYQDSSGEWIGFDADLARAFAESLGVDVEFQIIDWDNKVFELSGKTIDVVWNGMTLTSEVKSSMECSNPYFNNAQVVIVPADKAADYQDTDSIQDLSFAVESGSAGQEQAEAFGLNYTEVADQATALLEVSSGTADAAIIDILMAMAMTGEGTSYDSLTYTVSLNSEEYGVGFRKGSDLAAALNDFFVESYNDGSMQSIAETYGIADALVAQK